MRVRLRKLLKGLLMSVKDLLKTMDTFGLDHLEPEPTYQREGTLVEVCGDIADLVKQDPGRGMHQVVFEPAGLRARVRAELLAALAGSWTSCLSLFNPEEQVWALVFGRKETVLVITSEAHDVIDDLTEELRVKTIPQGMLN